MSEIRAAACEVKEDLSQEGDKYNGAAQFRHPTDEQ